MMKFRRSRSSGSYSVNPPQGETGEVAYTGKDDDHDGKYTLIDKETLSLPNTPRTSFRESVRKSLRKLKRAKRNKEKTKKKTEDAIYEVSLSYNTEVEEHEEKERNENKATNESNLEDLDAANQIVLKKHSSSKPCFRSQEETATTIELDNRSEVEIDDTPTKLHDVIQSAIKIEKGVAEKTKRIAKSGKSNRNSLLSEIANEVSDEPVNMQEKEGSFKCFPEIVDNQSFFKGKESHFLPRGPLGDLLKQKQQLEHKSVETVIVHNERNMLPQDESEYKVEHLEIDNLETKWVEESSTKEDDTIASQADTTDYDMTVTSKMINSTSLVEKHRTPAIVTHTRPAASSAEISLRMEEIVFLHRRLNAAWYYGEKRGVMGLIPASFIKIIVDADPGNESVRALATCTYNKRSAAELDLQPGQLVYLTHRLDYHWYLAQAGGSKGLVPAAYLEIISGSSDGSLPPVPAWAIKGRDRELADTRDKAGDTREMVGDTSDIVRDTIEKGEEDTGSRTGRSRVRKSQGKSKKKEDKSVRKDIMKSISRRNDPILFV